MAALRVFEHLYLSLLQGLDFGLAWMVFQIGIKLRHDGLRGRILDRPQGSQGAARARFDGYPSQPQRGAVITRGGLTPRKGQQFDGVVA